MPEPAAVNAAPGVNVALKCWEVDLRMRPALTMAPASALPGRRTRTPAVAMLPPCDRKIVLPRVSNPVEAITAVNRRPVCFMITPPGAIVAVISKLNPPVGTLK